MAALYNFSEPERDARFAPESAIDQTVVAKRLKQERIVAAIFGAVILGVIVLAIYQYRAMLIVPFPVGWDDKEKELAAAGTSSEEILAAADDTALKTADSDADGISDYDEKYIYFTSPYLADSDSDGVNDLEELKNREDPNCPKGRICFSASETKPSSELDATQAVPALANLGTDSTAAVDTSNLQDVDPAQLRALIIQSGAATEEQLKLVSDEELLQLYAQSAAASGGANGSVSPSTTMSASQIRAMLIEQGFTQEELSQVTDEELINMYKDALRDAQAKQ